jgi:hypothetical protein
LQIVVLAFAFLPAAAWVRAQPVRTATVVAGEKYAKPPGGQTWILGKNYRELWSTPIEAEVLDLGPGLAPVGRADHEQSPLILRSADGREFLFRPVEQDLTEALPWFLRVESVEDIAQDQLSATVPGVRVVVYPFARSLDLLEPEARLVVMPDDASLGAFHERFAGRLGVFLENPGAGFRGASEVQDADTFWSRRQEDPWNRADSAAFLKARLLDLYLGDWDRHRRKWRWARIPGERFLQPIADDRDQVFSDFEGLAMRIARSAGARTVTFEGNYAPLEDATQNGWDLDRFLLSDLQRSEWISAAEEMRARITDEVIEEGLRRLPPEYYRLVGAPLTAILRERRDRLHELALDFFSRIADKVDIHGSNSADVLSFESLDGGSVTVRLALARDSEPYFQRTFLSEETSEIRIYLHGGDDRVDANPARGSAIRMYVIGGDGEDTAEDAPAFVDFWDDDGSFRDPGLKDAEDDVPWVPSRDWGRVVGPKAVLGYHSDAGLLMGGGIESTSYGFRTYPWSRRHTLVGAFAVGVNRPFLDYAGEFRRRSRAMHFALEARFSGLDQLRYYGFGNETANDGTDDPYAISLYQVTLYPALAFSRGEERRLLLGPVIKLSDSSGSNPYTILAQQSPSGFGKVAQLGAKAELRYDSRVNRPVLAEGFEVRAESAVYPQIWDIEGEFGYLGGRFDVHRPLSDRLFLSLAAGGKKVWGDSFPFFEAAYLGGNRTTAGYNWNRFAGDASIFGQADLKITLHHLRKLIPGELGVTLQLDAGRVWLEEQPSSKWHPSYGAGIFYAPFSRFALFEAGIGRSSEQTFFTFRAQARFLEF